MTVIAAVCLALSVSGGSVYADKPLTPAVVEALLEAGTPAAEIIGMVERRGYGGTGKAAELKRLRQVGADAELLAAILDARSGPGKAGPAPSAAQSGSRQGPLAMPFESSMGMRFLLVPIQGGPTSGQKVLFSIWETRVRDYAAYAKDNPSLDDSWQKLGFQQTPDDPVVNVSWNEAKAFCAWLTKVEREVGRIGPKDEYRLPTDHEWSCAVGIGGREDPNVTPSMKSEEHKGVYPWGSDCPPPAGAGNFCRKGDGNKNSEESEFPGTDGFPYTAPVGSFSPNALGLHDLGGNVWEKCEDRYSPDKDFRVTRGGSWGTQYELGLRSSFRARNLPDFRSDGAGFRCVLVVAAPDR